MNNCSVYVIYFWSPIMQDRVTIANLPKIKSVVVSSAYHIYCYFRQFLCSCVTENIKFTRMCLNFEEFSSWESLYIWNHEINICIQPPVYRHKKTFKRPSNACTLSLGNVFTFILKRMSETQYNCLVKYQDLKFCLDQSSYST